MKLFSYAWEGINQQGLRVKGASYSTDETAIKSELYEQKILPLKIKKQFIIFKSQKINRRHIVDFSRQLASLIHAQIPLVSALKILAKSHENKKMAALIYQLKNSIEKGKSLSEALNHHPQYFNSLYCNLIHVGEQSSTLPQLLKEISFYQEKMMGLRQKIKKALFYPTTVVITACLVVYLLLIFAVPQFQNLFSGFGSQLPSYTQFIISISLFLKTHAVLLFSSIILLTLCFYWGKKYSVLFSQKIDRLLLNMPIIGQIMIKNILARMVRTLAITLQAGLPFIESLPLMANSTGNFIYRQGILQINKEIQQGLSIHLAMQNTALFPPRMIQTIAIAEESGMLIEMLDHLAEFYQREMENSVENLGKLLEPVIMIILGTLIGGIITAMYLPIFQLGSVI